MLTGKKNDLSTALSKSEREQLAVELAYHEESAARLESTGNMDTYHHQRAAELRAILNISEDDDGKLD